MRRSKIKIRLEGSKLWTKNKYRNKEDRSSQNLRTTSSLNLFSCMFKNALTK